MCDVSPDVLQQSQGVRVRRMQVVEDQHDWLVAARAINDAADGFQQLKSCLLRVESHLFVIGVFGQQLAKPAKYCRVWHQLLNEGAKNLRPRPIGGRAAALPGKSPEDRRTRCACFVGGIVRQRTFADAGFTRQHKHLATIA